jgi:uncharacterized Fe-S center protein
MGEEIWMKNVYFFTDLNRLSETLYQFDLEEFEQNEILVKLHMGEIKNKYYSKPSFVKHVIDVLKNVPTKPYLFDTTVAYRGLRHSKTGYLKLAKIHGFTKKKVGCDVVIDDNGIPVTIDGRRYDIADHIVNTKHIFAISHVKGHVATGMGGAIKNFGMGGVTKETKRRMHHGSRPLIQKEKCTFCGICAEICPFNAITVKNDLWSLNMRLCFGCGVCVDACNKNALHYKDADIQYLMACAAKACLQDKTVLYLNEIKRIARSCDCDPFAGPIICPDIGYVVSDDPVAIDKASIDLIYKVKADIFEEENQVSPFKQIQYGEEIGLGSSLYRLIEI